MLLFVQVPLDVFKCSEQPLQNLEVLAIQIQVSPIAKMNWYFKAERMQKALACELNFHSLTCKIKQAGLQHPIKAEITDI